MVLILDVVFIVVMCGWLMVSVFVLLKMMKFICCVCFSVCVLVIKMLCCVFVLVFVMMVDGVVRFSVYG